MNKNIHIGEIIKDELRRQGKTNSWFAEQLNVNPRTVNKIFLKSVIDTQQLFLISKALDVDFFRYYSENLR
ncbi:MAG: helix-turn-helix transcriptional regulator [Bacteroidales bacterium]|nr:helix-turn-helix transcriptional regulator [Bacteroidales bacterium]